MTPESNDPKRTDVDERLTRLERIIAQMAQTGTIGNTLDQGLDLVSGCMGAVTERLDLIAAQLQPLRRLEGTPVTLDPQHQRLLDNLIASVAPPNFSRVQALPSREQPVPYIGDIPEATLIATPASRA